MVGLLTYGCPLDRFAAIWPAKVPINRDEAVFRPDVQWINVLDRTDPVGSALAGFDARGAPRNQCLSPTNIGYAAHPILLYSHIRYLSTAPREHDQLSDRIAAWLIDGNSFNAAT